MPILTPPSSRTAFSGVANFYAAELAPLIEKSETRRRGAVRKAVFVAIAAAFVVVAFLTRGGDVGQIGAIITGLIGFGAAGAMISKARGEITHDILGRIASHLGYGYMRSRARPHYCAPLIHHKLLPRFNREDWEDEIAGAHEGVRFTLCETHLKYKTSGKNSHTRSVFHGQIIEVDYPHKFSGVTVIKRDAGVLNRLGKPGKQFQRIGLASARFEKAYEAWSTDQVEARVLLDPIMLERFEELERLFDGAKLRAVFADGFLYLALETGDKLSIGTMFQSIEGPARIEKILKEFDLIFDLIDVATRRMDGLTDGALSVDQVRTG